MRRIVPSTAAAPGGAHSAPRPSATNPTAPVQKEACAAVVKGMCDANAAPAGDAQHARAAGGERPAERVAAGAGIAGIAANAGPARRGADDGGAHTADAAGASTPAPTGPSPSTEATPAERTVLHVDIDAFFAAIEQQRDPRLAGRPVIVGAGVIASCSYEARAYGLRAGMRLSEAKRLCPQAVILEGHAQVYRCFAETIFERCRAIAPEVETYLDEAYCDLTGTGRLHGDPLEAARRLKHEIREATGLAVTCGIGPNRTLAKLIGKTVKPDGLARVRAAGAEAFLCGRPIAQLPGVGPAHARTLESMNVRTIGALRALPLEVLTALFGVHGHALFERCRGRDSAPVTARELPMSISRETSFHRDTADPVELEGMLEYLVGRACRTARELEIRPRTVAVRLRHADGEGAERARTLKVPSDADPVVLALALELMRRLYTRRVALHALGVTLSQFVPAAGEQGALFDEREAGRRTALYRAFDDVRRAYGHGVMVSGRALRLKGRLDEDRHGFVLRTPSLTK